MMNSIEPLKVTKEFNGTVEFVHNEKSCIWKKGIICTTKRTITGYRHAILLVTIEGSPVIVDWSVKLFVSTNDFVFVVDLGDIADRL